MDPDQAAARPSAGELMLRHIVNRIVNDNTGLCLDYLNITATSENLHYLTAVALGSFCFVEW